MIKRQRLQELIQQNAIVYYVASNEIYQLALTYKHNIYLTVEGYYICLYGNNGLQIYGDKLFESKAEAEDAEWHQEFGCIERTERLVLPTWEEFIKNYQTLGDNTILDERCVMFTCKTKTYSLYADDESIWVGCDNTGTSFFCEDLNKENYIKACRFCKRLFLNGGINEN